MARKPAQQPGVRRIKYRAGIERRLAELGFSGRRIRWETAPAGLTVIIGEEFRTFALHAGQSVARTEYEMGRLATWSEVLSLTPKPVAVPKPATRMTPHRKAALVGQIDLEDLIAAQSHANGHVATVSMTG